MKKKSHRSTNSEDGADDLNIYAQQFKNQKILVRLRFYGF